MSRHEYGRVLVAIVYRYMLRRCWCMLLWISCCGCAASRWSAQSWGVGTMGCVMCRVTRACRDRKLVCVGEDCCACRSLWRAWVVVGVRKALWV